MALARVERLSRIRLNSRAPDRLAAFFVAALGFVAAPSADGSLRLALGPTLVELAPAAPDGRAYPSDAPGWSPLFQHFAMATADIGAAVERLRSVDGWTAISEGGPQSLPPDSGGAAAFKFRDPEGHPLELIQFPGAAGPAPRIDHSAISVGETARSVGFYAALGLAVTGGSLNQGPEQAKLDGLADPLVEVTALGVPGAPGPHVELLCYRRPPHPQAAAALYAGDVAATRLVFEVASADALGAILEQTSVAAERQGEAWLLRDPDGHLLQFEIA